MAYLLGFAQFPQTFPPRYVNTQTLQKEWKLSMQRWPSGGVVLGGHFASSRHGGEGRISEKNTTLRVCFWSGRPGSNSLPGIPRMAVAIRRSPASPLDLTRFAQVEAASSPVLRHIPKRENPILTDGVFFLERATRLELASRHPTNGCRHSWEPCLTSDQTCFAQVEAASSPVLRHIPKEKIPS